MGVNLGPRPVSRHSGAAAPAPNEPRWGRDGKTDPISVYLSPQLGLAPKTVRNRICELPTECAAVIRAFRQLGDETRLASFAAPILRALEGREAPPDVPATWTRAQQADASEDVAELAYKCEPSDANLARLIASTRETIRHETAKLDMLEAEQQRRRSLA